MTPGARRSGGDAGGICVLCGKSVPSADVDAMTCMGCGAVICDDHLADPWGDHIPEEHDEEHADAPAL